MFLLQTTRWFFFLLVMASCSVKWMQRSSQGCSVFYHYSQQRLSFSESFLGDAICWLSLLAVYLSHCLLPFPQKCILGLSLLGDPPSCPYFKSQWEEISKAEMWGQGVTMPCLCERRSVLPFLAISSSQREVPHAPGGAHITSHHLFCSFFFFFFNGLCNVKYNAVKSFLLLNNRTLHLFHYTCRVSERCWANTGSETWQPSLTSTCRSHGLENYIAATDGILKSV